MSPIHTIRTLATDPPEKRRKVAAPIEPRCAHCDNTANIVTALALPCLHWVACAACADAGYLPTDCPTCGRTVIKLKVLRPSPPVTPAQYGDWYATTAPRGDDRVPSAGRITDPQPTSEATMAAVAAGTRSDPTRPIRVRSRGRSNAPVDVHLVVDVAAHIRRTGARVARRDRRAFARG